MRPIGLCWSRKKKTDPDFGYDFLFLASGTATPIFNAMSIFTIIRRESGPISQSIIS